MRAGSIVRDSGHLCTSCSSCIWLCSLFSFHCVWWRGWNTYPPRSFHPCWDDGAEIACDSKRKFGTKLLFAGNITIQTWKQKVPAIQFKKLAFRFLVNYVIRRFSYLLLVGKGLLWAYVCDIKLLSILTTVWKTRTTMYSKVFYGLFNIHVLLLKTLHVFAYHLCSSPQFLSFLDKWLLLLLPCTPLSEDFLRG